MIAFMLQRERERKRRSVWDGQMWWEVRAANNSFFFFLFSWLLAELCSSSFASAVTTVVLRCVTFSGCQSNSSENNILGGPLQISATFVHQTFLSSFFSAAFSNLSRRNRMKWWLGDIFSVEKGQSSACNTAALSGRNSRKDCHHITCVKHLEFGDLGHAGAGEASGGGFCATDTGSKILAHCETQRFI